MLQKQKIVPHLWFNTNAEDAANFYVSLFENSKILGITRYGSSDNKAGFAAGEVLTVTFQLEGQKFCAINGGTYFQLSEAMSFFVCCESQEEIDRLWEKLSEGGKIQECGWLKDRFGLSWQINWAGYEQLVAESAEKADRVLKALHGMKKVDIAGLQNA